MLRLAAGAATAGVAYHAGKRRAEQDEYNQQASAAYDSTMETPPGPSPALPPTSGDPVTALERLAQLHASGALSDEEFAAAKASVLGS
jgi:hypothetical protein